ncbi:hypothetical protein PITCH_A1070027 [uncultured Desulfobacterium sp.]|uniref:Uncharacterized protein n=1 Tax=uncultured Desulfobacterium sp. TaxID=201089 RepID=A0A445MQW7_9BACT|nr:hypothetical protein PITCH_A1070027 [uncultured Desulfobacterium sp.]
MLELREDSKHLLVIYSDQRRGLKGLAFFILQLAGYSIDPAKYLLYNFAAYFLTVPAWFISS